MNIKKSTALTSFALGVSVTFGLVYLTSAAPGNKVQDEVYTEYVQQNYKVFSLAAPDKVTFCGTEVPLDRHDVRESFDRELLVNTYWHSNTFLLHKRANRWFPTIEKILAEEGVPDDFKYLALIESGLTNAVSPAGARGFWQFMPATAKSYDLEVNNEVDERYHVEKATKAACAYLKDSYASLNDWSLVAASYNMGLGGVRSNLKKQKVDSYWDLLLNAETGRYVYRILAVKEILNNSGKYGFHLRPKDLYQPLETKSVILDSTVEDLAQYALDLGINYKILKEYNPWLRKPSLNNKNGVEYEILLPKEGVSLSPSPNNAD